MNLLITGAFSWTEEQMAYLKSLGWHLFYTEREDTAVDFDPSSIDAVICNWFFVNHDIKEFKKLKYIQLLSAGMDRVPMKYVNEHGIQIFNARGVYSIPMAEFALCGVLQLLKDSKGFYCKQTLAQWDKNRHILELHGRTVSVIGTGSVGRECARVFRTFTDQLYGVDLVPSEIPNFKRVQPIEHLDQVLAVSDIVIATLPLTDRTQSMFNKERFASMKQGAIFVNISRGGVVDEAALLDALKENLYGAVLDVFQSEPLDSNSAFWGCNNVILTPHNSFVSEHNSDRMWNVIKENITHETTAKNCLA